MAGGFRERRGNQYHGHGVEPGGTGAQSNQGIHVGVVIAKRLPGTDKEMAPGGGQHRQGQQADSQPDPLTGGAGLNHHVAAQQSPGHQRYAQPQAQPGMTQEAAIVLLLLLFAGAIIIVVVHWAGAIARLLYCVDQGLGIRRAADSGGAVGKVHLCLVDPRGVAQGVFDGAYAGGAGGTGNGKLLFLIGAGGRC